LSIYLSDILILRFFKHLIIYSDENFSLKLWQFFHQVPIADMGKDAELLAIGLLERVGINDSELKHKATGKEAYKLVQDVPNHE